MHQPIEGVYTYIQLILAQEKIIEQDSFLFLSF